MSKTDEFVEVYAKLINMGIPDDIALEAANKYPNNINKAAMWSTEEKKSNNSLNANSNSSYNTVFYEHFISFCKDVHYAIAQKPIKISSKFEKIEKRQVINCGLLSYWIYDSYGFLPLLKDTNLMVKKENKSDGNETTDWSFVIDEVNQTGYVVFRGTSADSLGIDVLTDISIVPTPIWCGGDEQVEIKSNNDNDNNDDSDMQLDEDGDDNNDWIDNRRNHHRRWDFAVHGGVYSSILRNYGKIIHVLQKYKNKFNKLYITGHSLGGALSILFGLELLLRNMIPTNVMCQIITFGAPNVLSFERSISKHRERSKLILATLHSMTHCFVNKFDIVPRIPSPWILEILLPAIPELAKQATHGMTNFGICLADWLYSEYVDGLRNQFIKHKKILNTFKPFGTYYILLHDKDKNFYIIDDAADNGMIKQILSFIPPVYKTEHQQFMSVKQDILHSKIKKITLKYILAHYYYRTLMRPNENESENNKLIRQKSVEFEDNVFKIPSKSIDEYSKMKQFLFKQNDLIQLIYDHYMDDYLNGLIPNNFNNDNALCLKISFLKLFNLGQKCKSGASFWTDIKEFVFINKLGTLKLQYHAANDKHQYVQSLTNAIRTVAFWSNHSDKYRLTLSSNRFTNNEWRELYHCNDLNALKSKFMMIQNVMQYWSTL